MRRTCLLLIVSLFIALGSSSAYADNRNNNGGPRQEQKGNIGKKGNGNKGNMGKPGNGNKGNVGMPGNPGNPGNAGGPGNSPAPGNRVQPRPNNNPVHQVSHRPVNAPSRLPNMVSQITKGCHDVNVWQIDDETYIVKYRKGNRYYTRRIYPYSNSYGNPSLISINWQPLLLWSLIRPIQLNINL